VGVHPVAISRLATNWLHWPPKQKTAAKKNSPATLDGARAYRSGGHGIRTRNPFRDTTFPGILDLCPSSSIVPYLVHGCVLRATANFRQRPRFPPMFFLLATNWLHGACGGTVVSWHPPRAKKPNLTSAPGKGTIVPGMGTSVEASLAVTLFSKSRRAVLALLFGQPDQEFYLRQICRVSGGGVGAIQRELKQLTEAGIVRRTVRNKQVYFQANADCPVFAELKSILVKTSAIADVLKVALAPLGDRIRIAFVFGSVARSHQRADSDVDLLIVGDVAFGEVVSAVADAQQRLSREVNPTVYSAAEFAAKVAAGHHFLTNVLGRGKVFLIGDERELTRLVEERLVD
jgi:predicted nucleotidyltransferase